MLLNDLNESLILGESQNCQKVQHALMVISSNHHFLSDLETISCGREKTPAKVDSAAMDTRGDNRTFLKHENIRCVDNDGMIRTV